MTQIEKRKHFDWLVTKATLMMVSILLPLYCGFCYFDRKNQGVVAMICTIAIAAAVRFLWDLRKHIWFWVTATILVFLHVLLIFFVPWPDVSRLAHKYSEIAFLIVVFLDAAVDYGCIWLVAKAVGP
jgi:hypothetical protein